MLFYKYILNCNVIYDKCVLLCHFLLFTIVSWIRRLATTTSSSIEIARRILLVSKNKNKSSITKQTPNEELKNRNGSVTAESSDDEGHYYGYTSSSSDIQTDAPLFETNRSSGNELLWSLLDKDKQRRM